MRRIGAYFNDQLNDLSESQLTDYFCDLLESHSWSSVKLDLYGLKFFYTYVLNKPWPALKLIKPPRTQRLPDIVTVEEAGRLFTMTHTLSYRVFFFTLYSLGLRLGEGLRLTVADIAYRDVGKRRELGAEALMPRGSGCIFAMPRATKTGFCSCKTCIHHIHVVNRLVPLPAATLDCLRRFWQVHRNPVLLFPNRHGGLKSAHLSTTPLDRGGVQATLRQVAQDCGIKKRLRRTVCAIVMLPI